MTSKSAMDMEAARRLRSAPSIPSKFETVLHFGAQEKDAFWNRTSRFTESVNALPGPGAYISKGSLENSSDSISRKGYGSGFVSKKSRFARDPIFRSPGPGSYAPPSFGDDLAKRYRTKNTSTFTKKVVPKTREPEPLPGPADYNIEKKKEKPSLAASFKSSTTRFLDPLEKPVAPPPGLYDVETAQKQLEKSKLSMPSSSFRSRTGRKFEQDKLKTGADQVELFRPPLQVGGTLGIELPKSPRRPTALDLKDTPGPGAYNPPIGIEEKDRQRPSSFFSTSTDRFGVPHQSSKVNNIITPGPGAYAVGSPRESSPQQALISSSFFMSGVERELNAFNPNQARPGPAYYTPAVNQKKSFHLNISRRWM
mmetsp:Transcript_32070/g.73531  ORF Transcript_32070/g.73531 Transcript_32070/m.73531 type:complete len:367 (-) Transcript_32070:52-1152(-)